MLDLEVSEDDSPKQRSESLSSDCSEASGSLDADNSSLKKQSIVPISQVPVPHAQLSTTQSELMVDAFEVERAKLLTRSDKIKITLIGLVCVGLIVVYFSLDSVSDSLARAIRWFDKNRVSSAFLIWALYAVSVPGVIPIKTVLAIIVGYLYGLFFGIILVFSAGFTGGVLAFLIGRYACKDTVRRWLYSRPMMRGNSKWSRRLATFDFLVGEYPFETGIALVLTPVPNEWLNYFLSSTPMTVRDFLRVHVVGRCLSKSSLYVYLGSVVRDSDKIAKGKVDLNAWVSGIITVVLLVCSFAIAWYLSKRSKEWLDQEARARIASMTFERTTSQETIGTVVED